MIRVVVDTNVLVSAMISSSGMQALLVQAIQLGLVQPCLSTEILKEYSEVLARPKFGFPEDEITALMELLRRRGVLVAVDPVERISPDPDDDKFIACAFAAKAAFIVTGNNRDFPEEQLGGIRVLNAGRLLHLIVSEL
jgi:putative PIN family toxin of toxin-antitoxin system